MMLIAIQMDCLALLRHIFSKFHGSASSLMRLLRSPSQTNSAQINICVQTVCGQVNPHQTRPTSTVTVNNRNAEITNNQARYIASCGQNVSHKIWNLRSGKSNNMAGRPSMTNQGSNKNP